MRQIRMLRAMRRELETALRILLTGHEGGNPGYSQGESYGLPRQLSTLPGDTRFNFRRMISSPSRRLLIAQGRLDQVHRRHLQICARPTEYTP